MTTDERTPALVPRPPCPLSLPHPVPRSATSFRVGRGAALVGGLAAGAPSSLRSSHPEVGVPATEGSRRSWTSGAGSAQASRPGGRSTGPASCPAAGAARRPRPLPAPPVPPPDAPPTLEPFAVSGRRPTASPISPGAPSGCRSSDRSGRSRPFLQSAPRPQLKNNRRTTEERCSSQAAGPSVPRRAGRSVSGSVSPRAGGGRPPPSPAGRRSPRTAARTPASAGSRPSPPRAAPGPPPGSPPRTHRSRARP